MSLRQPSATPRSVYALANHLDTILAACEDLLKSTQAARVGRLELTAIAHVLQAQPNLQELWVDDDALSDQATLFLAGTAQIAHLQSLGAQSRAPVPEIVTEDYLIGGQVPVGVIADVVSGLLNVLEARYGDLWDDPAEARAAA
jgi:hypothetical protein